MRRLRATNCAARSTVSGSASRRSPSCSRAPRRLLTRLTFPETHRRQIRSTDPLQRLNEEIERRTAVVGIFPTRASVIRLVGMIPAEQDDEWQDRRRYFRPETMALIDTVTEHEEDAPALLMAS